MQFQSRCEGCGTMGAGTLAERKKTAMDAKTAERLNAINREFYRTVADEFDTTRGKAWPGWMRLLPFTKQRDTLSVLDAGCGNGRFGAFLAEKLTNAAIRYHGIDSNAALMAHARETLAHYPNVTATFDLIDLVSEPLPEGAYELVALFGVLHHVPGAANRQRLVRALAERLAPGGLLAFSCWRFYEYERFRERIVPFPPDLRVEAGDSLLDWRRGQHALRYCHYVDDAEHEALVAASGLAQVATYRADGQPGDANRYSILQR
jgi:tRNA (uracil-5-)-methyltransferase TRM9